jgi:hypothetical protein
VPVTVGVIVGFDESNVVDAGPGATVWDSSDKPKEESREACACNSSIWSDASEFEHMFSTHTNELSTVCSLSIPPFVKA